jgi:polysaccharide biosynthesis protein PslE
VNNELVFAPTGFEPMRPRPPVANSLREMLTNLVFDGRRIVAAVLLGLLATALAAWFAPRAYVADASLLLRLGREYFYTPEVGDPAGTSPIAYDREQTQLAEARIMTSRDLHETVLDRLGVAKVYPKIAAEVSNPAEQRARALKLFSKSVDADLLKGSNLLQISFRHDDPVMAATVLSQLIDGYLNKRLAVFSNGNRGSVEAEFKTRKSQLEAAEAALVAFKTEHGIRSFAEEMSLLLAQRNVLDQRLADNSLALAQSGGRTASLRLGMTALGRDVTLSTETQRSEAVDHARKLLLDLQLKERDLSAKFSDSHLSVQDVRADIGRTTAFLKEYESRPQRNVRSGRSPARDAAEGELVRAQAEQRQALAGTATLAGQRTAIDQRLAVLSGGENQLRVLERERRLAEVNYEAVAKRQRDEQALEDLDRKRRSNVSVVQSPRVPTEPKSMRTAIVLVGLALTLCGALLVALLSALMRETFLTPEQLQRSIDLPLLAAIPRDRP